MNKYRNILKESNPSFLSFSFGAFRFFLWHDFVLKNYQSIFRLFLLCPFFATMNTALRMLACACLCVGMRAPLHRRNVRSFYFAQAWVF